MDCMGYKMNIFLGEEVCRKEICQPKTPRYAEDWKFGEIVFKVVRKSSQESSQEMPEHVRQFVEW